MQRAHVSNNTARRRRMNTEDLKNGMIELKMNEIGQSAKFPAEFLPQRRPSSQKQPPKKSHAALPRSAGGTLSFVSSDEDKVGIRLGFAVAAP